VCFLLTLLLLGPRVGIVIYGLAWPARWDAAFDSWLVPLVGFFLFPWTTLMYVLVAPSGVDGFDYVLLALAAVGDVASLGAGGGYQRSRGRQAQYS
jgi:hypothetical protein